MDINEQNTSEIINILVDYIFEDIDTLENRITLINNLAGAFEIHPDRILIEDIEGIPTLAIHGKDGKCFYLNANDCWWSEV